MNPVRYCFAPAKALAALHYMVSKRNGIDLHTILKACYFADKEHLNQHYRPIFGATYRAMKFGPVPLEIYEMAKGESLWLAELGVDRFPWRLEGYRLKLEDNGDCDLSDLSESDIEALERGFQKSTSMDFNERTSATHGPDWQAAQLGFMRYEDMLEDTAHKSALIADMRETAHRIRL